MEPNTLLSTLLKTNKNSDTSTLMSFSCKGTQPNVDFSAILLL